MLKRTLLIFLLILVLTACGKDTDNDRAGFQVEFILDGETVHTDTVNANGVVTKYEPTLDQGKSLENWYTDESNTLVYDFTTPITSDLRLYGNVLDSFETIKEYLIDNGDYTARNELGRESETYRLEIEQEELTMFLIFEIVNDVEYYAMTFGIADRDGYSGLYIGLSATKENHLDGLVHVYAGGSDASFTWQGIDCSFLRLSEIDSAVCSTFSSDIAVNDYFHALVKDNLVAFQETANQYYKEQTGCSLK